MTVVPAASKVLLTTLTLSNPGIGETIRRTRGSFLWDSDQAVADEDYMGAFGLIVVSDLAVAAGVASIPGPVTDANDDGWFVWEPMLSTFEFASVVGFESSSGLHGTFDSKAMRKVEEGFSIAIVVENASADGARFALGFSVYATRN